MAFLVVTRLGGRDGCIAALTPGHVSTRGSSNDDVMSLFCCSMGGGEATVQEAFPLFASFEFQALGWSGTRSHGFIAGSAGSGVGGLWGSGGGEVGEAGFSIKGGRGDRPAAG